jgi:outer membrane protein
VLIKFATDRDLCDPRAFAVQRRRPDDVRSVIIIGAELILATTEHKAQGRGTLSGVPTLAKTWVLPPTLTLQYHFLPDAKIRPYVGAGINDTIFYNEDPGAAASIEYDNGFGYAFQAGADYMLDEHWMLNADVKKIFLNTDASVNNGAVTADVDLDPWVFGLGIGYRF